MTEHGFHHPERGYWQTTDAPSETILAKYPEGTKEVPLKGPNDGEWNDALGKWEPLPPADLADLKTALKAQIDTAAESERLKYITPGAGQALTYRQKADEATRYLSTGNPVDSDYPMLMASLGIEGDTLHKIAMLISTNNAKWLMIGAAIEQIRLATKYEIDRAQTPDEAMLIAENPEWPHLELE